MDAALAAQGTRRTRKWWPAPSLAGWQLCLWPGEWQKRWTSCLGRRLATAFVSRSARALRRPSSEPLCAGPAMLAPADEARLHRQVLQHCSPSAMNSRFCPAGPCWLFAD